MGISYRRLTQAEGLSYREIRLESLRLHPDEFGSSYEEQSRLPKLNFEKALEELVDERFVIGAFDGDCLIGICGFIPYAGMGNEEWKTNSTGTIVQVYVRPAYRGRKIGLGLVRAVVREVFRIEWIMCIVLGVRRANSHAIQVYKDAGFRAISSASDDDESSQQGLWMILDRDG